MQRKHDKTLSEKESALSSTSTELQDARQEARELVNERDHANHGHEDLQERLKKALEEVQRSRDEAQASSNKLNDVMVTVDEHRAKLAAAHRLVEEHEARAREEKALRSSLTSKKWRRLATDQRCLLRLYSAAHRFTSTTSACPYTAASHDQRRQRVVRSGHVTRPVCLAISLVGRHRDRRCAHPESRSE